MRVAGIQLDIAWEDREENFRRVSPWLDAAKGAGAEMVILPEMFSCGFSMSTDIIAEPLEGPSAEFLSREARRTGMTLCGSAPEKEPGLDKPHNSLILAQPDGDISRYRKIHPFTFAKEDQHYQAGEDFLTVKIGGVRFTFFICYDLRFADEFWQTAGQTDCFVVIANWPAKRRLHWTALLTARAIENQAYVIGVNRVGRGDQLDYAGDSMILDAWGETLSSAASAETMILADVHGQRVEQTRERFPILPDRR